jgi:hypothetical protein
MVTRKVYLAPDQVAEPPEHEGADRPHRKPGGEGQQGEDEAAGGIERREELPRDDRGQRAIQVEVVPLEHGAEAGGQDHLPVALAEWRGCSGVGGAGVGHGSARRTLRRGDNRSA